MRPYRQSLSQGRFNSSALMILTVLIFLLLVSSGKAADSKPVTDISGSYQGHKILWVDSYHQGYPWSDGIAAGITQVLKDSGVQLEIVRMDTKRNHGEEDKRQAGLAAKQAIDRFHPDLVIASDDNAQKHLVVPYLKGTSLPVVFCGVNAEASAYGYPDRNITGMLEVEAMEAFRAIAKGLKE